MGDVVLCLPVLRAALQQNIDLQIDLLTRPSLAPVFAHVERLQVLNLDVDKDYAGLRGLFNLSGILNKNKYDIVLDLHDVLRTKLLCAFLLPRRKIYRIDKERKAKRSVLGRLYKMQIKLHHTTWRYAQVFRQAGFQLSLQPHNFIEQGIIQDQLAILKVNRWINLLPPTVSGIVGIAPFSQHRLKEYPLERIQQILQNRLITTADVIVLFGHGPREREGMLMLKNSDPSRIFLSMDHFSLEEEIVLMSRLKFMLTMDSANMHLAELSGCPQVISVWGPTHTVLGFAPYFSDTDHVVEIAPEELSCRPCSMYGQKPCHRGDHACMTMLTPERIMTRLSNIPDDL